MSAIDLSPLLPVVTTFGVAALSVLGSWALKKFGSKLHLDIQGQQAELLESALRNALNFGAAKAGVLVGPHLKIETKNEIVANAANYVVGHVPGALASLGVTAEQLAEKLEARLGGKIAAAPAVPAKP